MFCVFLVFSRCFIDSNPIFVNLKTYYIINVRFFNLNPSSGGIVECSNNQNSVYVYQSLFDSCFTTLTALQLSCTCFEIDNTVFVNLSTTSSYSMFNCEASTSSIVSCICLTKSYKAQQSTAIITGVSNINSINSSNNWHSSVATSGIALYSTGLKSMKYSCFENNHNSNYCVVHHWSTNSHLYKCSLINNSYDISHYGLYHNHYSTSSSEYVNFFRNKQSNLFSGSASSFTYCYSDDSSHLQATFQPSKIEHIFSNCSINMNIKMASSVISRGIVRLVFLIHFLY